MHPHDPAAYTQGLLIHDGRLFESTGLYGESSLREIDWTTGEIRRRQALPEQFFGEGLAWHDGELWMLTWREQTAFVYNPDVFAIRRTYRYEGEGWGLTSDGRHLIMSDGTSTLRWMNPADFTEARRISVTEAGRPLLNLNELEWIDGQLLANVYLTDRVVAIDPENGRVTASMDLSSLRAHLPRPHQAEVLNGIAFDPSSGHLLVTGKNWPALFVLKWR